MVFNIINKYQDQTTYACSFLLQTDWKSKQYSSTTEFAS
jgi:hypothetical protein